MTFQAIPSERNAYGLYYERYYTFSGVSGDTGGTIDTDFKTILLCKAAGNLSDGSNNLQGLSAGRTAVSGQVRVTYTDPAANHEGLIKVVGRY